MNISVLGTGYVGLVVAACLAEVGNQVIGFDIDEKKIKMLQQGQIPIYEPGLAQLLEYNLEAQRIRFTHCVQEAVNHAECIFIAVGTPADEDGSADLQHVLAVAKDIGQHMQSHKIIVDKSTVPVGTVDKVTEVIQQQLTARSLTISFDVVSNPEFLKEGVAIKDFRKPDRIILGLNSATAEQQLRKLYAPFNRNHNKLLVMDPRSAELTKYAANALLATKISFMNEIANLAEQVGADVEKIRVGIGSDPRIGYDFIYAGCGYGGSCFAKDVNALIKTAEQFGCGAQIIKAAEAVNHYQKTRVFSKLQYHFEDQLQGKTIAIWGLAFKPGTDDIRQAPSCTTIEALLAAGAQIQAYDPKAMPEINHRYGHQTHLKLTKTLEQALIGADALVILTDWQKFKSPDFEKIKAQLTTPVIVDGRNLFDPQWMKTQGFIYYGIGRGTQLL
jgi:UDPglucose 6-dehydrogenase